MPQRSTTLHLVAQHCPRALDFYDAQTPRDRDVFGTGIAAHAVLQAIAQGDPVDQVCEHLVTKGRSFDGVPEPPLPADQVAEGRRLALAWNERHPLPENAYPEFGSAVKRDWTVTAYDDPGAYYRCIYDLIWTETVEEEEYSARVVVTRDYKSSWRATAEDLDSIQMKGQALLAIAQYPGFEGVRTEIGNLRTGRLYSRTLWLDDHGHETLDEWRNDLALAIAAAEHRGEDGRRPAAPGVGCMGCPYLSRCDAARDHIRGTVYDREDPAVAMATRLAVVDAMAAELRDRTREATKEEPIHFPGGVVGYLESEGAEPTDDAFLALAHAWFGLEDPAEWEAENGALIGLLKALKPGVSSLRNAAKVLHPFTKADPEWKTKRQDLIDRLTTQVTRPKFQIAREK